MEKPAFNKDTRCPKCGYTAAMEVRYCGSIDHEWLDCKCHRCGFSFGRFDCLDAQSECGDENEFLDTKRRVRCTLLRGHAGWHYCQDQTGNSAWTWPNKKDGHTCGECAHWHATSRSGECDQRYGSGMNIVGKEDSLADRCDNFIPRDPAPLPCPWCGEMPIVNTADYGEGRIYWVSCKNNECQIHPRAWQGKATAAEAVADWHKRA